MSVRNVKQQDRLGSRLMKEAVAKGPLEEGVRQRAVRYLERALQVAGFDPGKKDNKYTAETAKAVREFQAAWGLEASGKLDEKTLNKLDHTLQRARKHGSGCPDCNKAGFQGTIGVGQKNMDVFQAEQRLKKLGYATGKVDGVFDQQTAAAVRQFKADQPGLGKDETGLLGKRAFEALGKETRAMDHAPYRRRLMEGHAQHRRLNAATAEAARKQHADGTQGIGEGSSMRWVKNVQKHLKAAGYDPKRADGGWDSRTELALKTFQKKSGLEATGRVDADTWSKLSKSFILARNGTSPAQGLGERSAAVLRSEKLLKKLGYKNVQVDGIFDRATQRASRAFEKRHEGLGDDGRIGAGQLEKMKEVLRKRAGAIHAGGGWGGSKNVANAAKKIAASMGIPITSQKRNLADTIRVGSSTSSDHYTGNKTAFAVDFGVSGSRGDQLAQRIAKKYGIPQSHIGTFNGHIIKVDGQNYRLQLLWRVAGHFDHVHFGIRRA